MAKYINILKSRSYTSNTDSAKIYNWEDQDALHLVVNVTSGANLVVDIKGFDEESDTAYTLLTSSALGTGTTVLRVGPDYTTGTNTAKDYMPATWFVSTTLSGATTFSIGASLI